MRFQQEADDVRPPRPDRELERAVAVAVRAVRVGARRDQEARRLDVSFGRRVHERRPADVAVRDLLHPADERDEHLEIVARHARVRVGAAFYELARLDGRPGARRPHERRHAVLVGAVDAEARARDEQGREHDRAHVNRLAARAARDERSAVSGI